MKKFKLKNDEIVFIVNLEKSLKNLNRFYGSLPKVKNLSNNIKDNSLDEAKILSKERVVY